MRFLGRAVTSRGPDSDTKPPALRIELLGGFRVSVGGLAVRESVWRLRKARAIVKLLALADGRRMTQDELLELLWPGHNPDAAVNNFHRTLHAARSALGDAGLLRLHQGLLSLGSSESQDTVWIDVDAFIEAAAAVRRAADPARYEQAIALYTGDLLPEDLYEDWAANRREALRREYLGLLLDLAQLYESRGLSDAAIDPLRRARTVDPFHEDALRGLLRALAASGQSHEARREYERFRAALADELDAEPDAVTTQLFDDIRTDRFPAASVAPSIRNDRPALPVESTSFIGRERELREVEAFLGTARVVTLTGPGGVGKSRIALRVATRQAEVFRDGAAFVALDVVSDSDMEGALATIARAIGVRETGEQSLRDAVLLRLRSAHLLLLLDNVEHVMDVAQLLAEIAATCTDVTLLVTSRERLRIVAEQEVPIHPLPLPSVSAATNDASDEWAVVQLFVERARAVDPAFKLTPENTDDILALCGQLDALPLAIELAAARVKLLTPQAMRERLAHDRARLDLLAGGARDLPERQRTMRGAVAWSYQMLAPAERMLLQRLAVCPSGCTLELVEALARERDGNAADMFEHVATLVDRSLLRRVEADGEPRLTMLETIREFALEQLTASGERAAAERALALALIALAEQAADESTGTRQSYWLRRIDAEHGNLRGTLAWIVASHASADLSLGLRLGAVLWRFWYVQGFLSEGRGWLDALIARTEAVRSIPRGRTLLGAAVLAQAQGDYEIAVGYLDASIELCRTLSDREGTALALNQRGLVYRDHGQLSTAEETIAEGLGIFRELKQPWGVALSLNNLGVIAQRNREYERSSELLEESLRLFRESGDIWAATMPLASLSQVALDRRDFERAARLSQESLRVYEAMGDTRNVAIALSKLARVAEARGELAEAAAHSRASLLLRRDVGDREGIIAAIERLAAIATAQTELPRAVTLLAAASGLREQIGAPPSIEAHHEHTRIQDAARQSLDDATFVHAWGAGWLLSFDDAIRLAAQTDG